VFLPDLGFYSVRKADLSDRPMEVFRESISDFIRSHTPWLNQQQGFNAHQGSLETEILYSVNTEGSLNFEKRLPRKGLFIQEFGSWVYVKGEGFFNQLNASTNIPLELSASIRKDLVPSFIRRHEKDLKNIPGFFAEDEPFQKVGLEIGLRGGQ